MTEPLIVYVLTETRGMTYEGDTYVRGVYATEQAAEQAQAALKAQPSRPDDTEVIKMKVQP